MSNAILALWNDYPAAMAEEYEAWHTFEHVPERLTVPGMHAARRYISSADRESYFTLYELQDLTVIEHPAYLDLVRNPTLWSSRMRQHFSNVLRIPGETIVRAGNGIGGAAVVQAYSVERSKALSSMPKVGAILKQFVKEACILGFQLALAEPNQIYEAFEQNESTDPDTVNVVVIAESTSVDALSELQAAMTDQLEICFEPRKILRNDLFRLLISYRGDEFPSHRSQIVAKTMWPGGGAS